MNKPTLAFYHPNGKGTGAAIKMTLHPATSSDDGYIEAEFLEQKTVGCRLGPNPVDPTFDSENSLKIRLDFNSLCLMLQVFRGETESIDGSRGIFFHHTDGFSVFRMQHIIEPVCGYSITIENTMRAPGGSSSSERNIRFMLSNAEALGICEAIAGSMAAICFGIPTVINH